MQAEIALKGQRSLVGLPGYLKALEIMRHKQIVELGCQGLQAQRFNLTQREKEAYESVILKICFDVYFRDLEGLSKTVAAQKDFAMVDFLLQ